MKIYELLCETADSHFSTIKAMNAEFKQMAADVDLTLVAGMGWPNITQKGGWFGGGLGNKGGNKKVDNLTITIPIEIRRKAFLKMLSKKLEGFLDEGREVQIGQGASRSAHSEKAIKGQIFHQLMANLVEVKPPGNVKREKMPCVVWFVSHESELASKTSLCIEAHISKKGPTDNTDYLYVNVGGIIDATAARELLSAFNKFCKAVNAPAMGYFSSSAPTPKWNAFIFEIGTILAKITGNKLSAADEQEITGRFKINKKAFPPKTQQLTSEQMELITSTMWKHMK